MLTLTKEQYVQLQTQLLEIPAKYSISVLQYLSKLVQEQEDAKAKINKPWPLDAPQ